MSNAQLDVKLEFQCLITILVILIAGTLFMNMKIYLHSSKVSANSSQYDIPSSIILIKLLKKCLYDGTTLKNNSIHRTLELNNLELLSEMPEIVINKETQRSVSFRFR